MAFLQESTWYRAGFSRLRRKIGEAVLSGRTTLQASENDYDRLGPGVYFWEGSPSRALEFATKASSRKSRISKGTIAKPFVLGALIDVGACLNLLDSDSLDEVAQTYELLKTSAMEDKPQLPSNHLGDDRLIRNLDCAVIQLLHSIRRKTNRPAYDSVRAAFLEGGELYPGAGFCKRSHTQIAILNPTCIKAYFRPIIKS